MSSELDVTIAPLDDSDSEGDDDQENTEEKIQSPYTKFALQADTQ